MNSTNLTDEGLKAKSKELLNQIDATERLGPAEYIYMDRIITLTLQQVRDAARKEERERCAKVADGDIPNHFEWESELNDILHSAAHGKFASNQDLGNALMKWKCKNSITSTAIRQME